MKKSSSHKPAAGRTALKIVGVVAALAIAGTAFSLHRRGRQSGLADVKALRGSVMWKDAVASAGKPVMLKRLSAAEIPPYNLTATLSIRGPEGTFPTGENTSLQRVLESGDGERLKLSSTLVKQKAFIPGGGEVPEAQTPRNPLQGKESVVAFDAAGQLTTLQMPEGAEKDGNAMMTAFLTAAMEPNRFSPGREVKPGEEWDRRIEGKFPGEPDSSYSITQNVRFEGMAEHEGKTFARCSVWSVSLLKNIPAGEQSNPKYTTTTRVVERRVDAAGDVYIDPATGRAHHVVLEGVLRSENSQTISFPGRSEKTQSPNFTNQFPFRNEFHVEYTS